jgi:hypothetical protein
VHCPGPSSKHMGGLRADSQFPRILVAYSLDCLAAAPAAALPFPLCASQKSSSDLADSTLLCSLTTMLPPSLTHAVALSLSSDAVPLRGRHARAVPRQPARARSSVSKGF